jgi:hypothetical protein
MKMSQGNSLCDYLMQTKMSFFFHLQNHKTGRIGPVWVGGTLVPMEGGGGERV